MAGTKRLQSSYCGGTQKAAKSSSADGSNLDSPLLALPGEADEESDEEVDVDSGHDLDDDSEGPVDFPGFTTQEYDAAFQQFQASPYYRTPNKTPTYDVFTDPGLESEGESIPLIKASRPLDISLLFTSRQIYTEAMPVFYGGLNFIIDVSGLNATRFFRSLPIQARESVTTVTIASAALFADDLGVRWTWSGDVKHPKIWAPAPMVTPFGAFLATKLPKLNHIYLYVPSGGGTDFYCTWALKEVEILLAFKCVERVSFVFCGKEAGDDLRKCKDSEDCFERMLGLLAEDALEQHIFELSFPDAIMDQAYSNDNVRKALRTRLKIREMWAMQNVIPIEWEWADRDTVDMGPKRTVQAVCEFRLGDQKKKDESGQVSMESVRDEKGIRRAVAKYGRMYADMDPEG